MLVEPGATPVTAKVAVFDPAGMATVAGTVAIDESPDERLTVSPPGGATAESVNVKFWAPPTVTFWVLGVNVKAPGTFTVCVVGLKPPPEAVMFAVPMFTPVMVGWTAGVVAPAGMDNCVGVIVTREGSLLASVIVVPPLGAETDKDTGNAVVAPGATVALAGRTISPN